MTLLGQTLSATNDPPVKALVALPRVMLLAAPGVRVVVPPTEMAVAVWVMAPEEVALRLPVMETAPN